MSMLPADFDSVAWLRFKEEAEARLAEQRARNDNIDLSADETAKLRGRVAELKYWLARDKPPGPVVDTDHG